MRRVREKLGRSKMDNIRTRMKIGMEVKMEEQRKKMRRLKKKREERKRKGRLTSKEIGRNKKR